MSSMNGIQQAVTIHNSLSTAACTPVDTFAIVYALLDCVDDCVRHLDKVCDLTLCSTRKNAETSTRLSLCGAFHSIISLRSHFEIHNNNKGFSSMSQSQSIGWVKQMPDNNCQTTGIVSKSFIQFFPPTRYIYVCIFFPTGTRALLLLPAFCGTRQRRLFQ